MNTHRLPLLVFCAGWLFTAAAQDSLTLQEPRPPAMVAPVFGTQPFRATVTGTCTNKDDFSFTGILAGLAPGQTLRIHCVVTGRSTHGLFSAQILAEEQVTANGCISPAGAPGGEAVFKGYIAVLSFTASEDQLFLKLSATAPAGTECLTGPGTSAPGRGTLDVIGGTGRYQGATGTLAHFLNPFALAFSALPGDGFLSAFSGSFDGSLTLQ